jgi:hypothetical protein
VRWRKLGRAFAPAGDQWWARTHAFIPTADVLDERTIRVYFTGLDAERYGRVGFVELDARDPLRVLRASAEPVLDLGALGAFDDCGVNASCIVTTNGRKRLYYIGWQRAERVPHLLFTGLAESGDGAAAVRARGAGAGARSDRDGAVLSLGTVRAAGGRRLPRLVLVVRAVDARGRLGPLQQRRALGRLGRRGVVDPRSDALRVARGRGLLDRPPVGGARPRPVADVVFHPLAPHAPTASVTRRAPTATPGRGATSRSASRVVPRGGMRR